MSARGSGFWNLFAKRYAKNPVSDQAAYQEKLDVTRRYLTPDAQVLEYGCGTGTTAIYHAPVVAGIRAVDFSPAMIQICRDKAAAAGVQNITFDVASVADLPLDPVYDMVMAHSVLHLLPDWHDAIARSFQMLKPGGYFVTSTACLGQGGGLFKAVIGFGAATRILPPVQFFSHAELIGAMTSAGFEIAHDWQPNPKAAVFLVARKPDQP